MARINVLYLPVSEAHVLFPQISLDDDESFSPVIEAVNTVSRFGRLPLDTASAEDTFHTFSPKECGWVQLPTRDASNWIFAVIRYASNFSNSFFHWLPMLIHAHIFPPNCTEHSVSPVVELTYYSAYSYCFVRPAWPAATVTRPLINGWMSTLIMIAHWQSQTYNSFTKCMHSLSTFTFNVCSCIKCHLISQSAWNFITGWCWYYIFKVSQCYRASLLVT